MRDSFKAPKEAGEKGLDETPQAASSTAVVLAEAVKLVVSLLIQRIVRCAQALELQY